MDLNVLLIETAGALRAMRSAAEYGAKTARVALDAQRQAGESVLKLLESSAPEAGAPTISAKGMQLHVIA